MTHASTSSSRPSTPSKTCSTVATAGRRPMADTLTIAAAARLCHCDRRTLQRAIHTGRLHLDAQHGLSREELIRTGYLLDDTPLAAPQATPLETPLLVALERLTL